MPATNQTMQPLQRQVYANRKRKRVSDTMRRMAATRGRAATRSTSRIRYGKAR